MKHLLRAFSALLGLLASSACVQPVGVVDRVGLPSTESPTPSPSPSSRPSPRPSPQPSVTPSPTANNGCVPSTIAGKGTTTLRPLGTTAAPYGYIEYLPPGYDPKGSKLWPLVVMLHGSGERGNGTTQLAKAGVHGPNRRIREGREFPAVVLTPQLPTGAGSWPSANVNALVTYAFAEYRLDPARFYLTGLSLGGGGTWGYVRAFASRLAAAIPICGAADANDSSVERAALLAVPIYAVQNLDDPRVRYTRTLGFANSVGAAIGAANEALDGYLDNGKNDDTTAILNYAAKKWEFDLVGRQLRDAKGNLRSAVHTAFTFPQRGGHDAWTKTYAAEDTWNWLFCQRKK